ncbi:protein tyrosine phosphatase family protein [Parasphingopyxis sp.]|uniref:protein tyrosine phosphatase family protein n=1 Tax=Parasphingopyxis sp. TaxID=1920299 RepID=UPI0026266A82|nr:protein tyrosine phosphatase family protein [Parasphingopyxis sp.]
MRTFKCALVALASVTLAVSPGAAESVAPLSAEMIDNSGFSGTLGRYGDLYIASQPDEAGLARMAAAGVTTVINLRTPGEMERLSFDQAAAVERLGMRYVHVPQGGSDYPATPEALAEVAAAIDEADGAPVLLHCASSGRASHMFAAWLYRDGGVSLNEAIYEAREIGFGMLRVEGLLGTPFFWDIPASAAMNEAGAALED